MLLSRIFLLAARVRGMRTPRRFEAAMMTDWAPEKRLEFLLGWSGRTLATANNLDRKGDKKEGAAVARHAEGILHELIWLGQVGVTGADLDRLVMEDTVTAWGVAALRMGDVLLVNNILTLVAATGTWSRPATWDQWTRRLSRASTTRAPQYTWTLEATVWLERAASGGSMVARDQLQTILRRLAMSIFNIYYNVLLL